MKLMILLFTFFLTFDVVGQNIVLPDGEYMDTSSNQDIKCRNYTAYFYQVGGIYPESSSSLLKEVQVFMKSKNKTYSGSGYITFRFTVNCEGKVMNMIQVMQTDEKYHRRHFDMDLVNELYSFFKSLNKWEIARSPKGIQVSYFAYMAFKIKDGAVINIIP